MLRIEKWSILAGLRFVLASVVAFNHLRDYTDLGFLSFVPQFGAFESIMGFLLISGYSVSVSYLKEPGRFIFRRLSRLYPIYIASIVIAYLVAVYVSQENIPSPGYLLLNVLFLNQLVTNWSFVGPAWSLSLEFWLYCLVPVLMLARPGWNRAVVYISFVSYLLYTMGRTLFHLPYYSSVAYGGNLLFLSFIWICGLRLARQPDNPAPVMRDVGLIFTLHIALAAGIQFMARVKHHLIGAFFREDLFTFLLPASTLLLVYAVFAKCVLARPEAPRTRSQILRFLGDVSYPLYLIHISIFIVLSKTALRVPLAFYLVALTASAVLYYSVDFYSKRRHLQVRANAS